MMTSRNPATFQEDACRAAHYWALAGLGFAIALIRTRYLYEPFDNDIPIRLAYAARAVDGANYYSDLFVFGPPGILLVNELFARVFGPNELCVYLMGITAALITLLGVHRFGLRIAGCTGGLVAAVTWALVSGDLFTQANQPNGEVYINAAIVWGFVLISADARNTSPWRFVAAGLLFFLASSMKHFMAIVPVLAAMTSVVVVRREAEGWGVAIDRSALRAWLIAGSVAALAWAFLFLTYAASGRMTQLLDALFGSSLHYAGQGQGVLGGLKYRLAPERFLPAHQAGFAGLYLCMLLVLCFAFVRGASVGWRVLPGWGVGTWLAVSASGHFFPHYYMLWMPLLCLGCAGAYFLATRLPSQSFARAATLIILGNLVLVGLKEAVQYWRYDAVGASLAKYPVQGFVEVKEIGRRLGAIMPASDEVFELGAHGIYFYMGRLAPMPFVDSLYGREGQFPEQYRKEMLPRLLRNPPRFLVVRRSVLDGTHPVELAKFAKMLFAEVPYVERPDWRDKVLTVLERVPQEAADSRTLPEVQTR